MPELIFIVYAIQNGISAVVTSIMFDYDGQYWRYYLRQNPPAGCLLLPAAGLKTISPTQQQHRPGSSSPHCKHTTPSASNTSGRVLQKVSIYCANAQYVKYTVRNHLLPFLHVLLPS